MPYRKINAYLCGMELQKKLLRTLSETCKRYQLLADGDRVLVALSGGKDSLALLDLMALRSHILKPRFLLEAAFVRMTNIGYASDEGYLREFSESRGVPFHILDARFDPSTDHRKQPCFLCAWNRRKQLFELAKRLGCNKIALGHHKDDIIQTALLNLTFVGQFSSMRPRMQMDKFPMTLIRPLCLMRESQLREYAQQQGFCLQKKVCPYDTATRRADMRDIAERLEALNPELEYSVWHALEAVSAAPFAGERPASSE